MTKRTDSRLHSEDSRDNTIDSKINWMHSTNALEHNPLLLKPPHKNSKETHNFGTKLRHFAQLSITNTTMPHKPEDKNSNLLHNLKS